MLKDKIIEVLADWNYWDKEIPDYIPRPEYNNQIERAKQSEEVVVLRGIRRCGKSTLLINQIKDLVKGGVLIRQCLFVNFEDPRLSNDLNVALLDDIFMAYQEYVNPDLFPYIFFDEIQNISLWEKWVRTKYELKQAQLYVTGSSSTLLSKEFGTALAGRYLPVNVFPLNFSEYIVFKGECLPDTLGMISKAVVYKRLFNSYLKEGGFPKVILSAKDMQKKELDMYFESIILKDIMARYGLKNYDNLRKLALYLMSNIGCLINLNKLKVALNISYELLSHYYEYIKDTFLIYELSAYEYSLKKQFSKGVKIYCIDNGMIDAVSFQFSENKGRMLENMVCFALKRKSLAVYFHSGKRECDFIVEQDNKVVQAIQVCLNLENPETKQREVDGLLEAMHLYELKEGVIITEDENDEKLFGDRKIVVMPAWKWLLTLDAGS